MRVMFVVGLLAAPGASWAQDKAAVCVQVLDILEESIAELRTDEPGDYLSAFIRMSTEVRDLTEPVAGDSAEAIRGSLSDFGGQFFLLIAKRSHELEEARRLLRGFCVSE